jgi:hypothetical protein
MVPRKAKLTKRLVEDLTVEGGRERWVWDSDLPGFALRVKPSGIKAYVVQYRNAQRRPRKITLGRHGVITPNEARRMARQTLAAIERGEDPAEQRRANRDAVTIADLCDRYLAEHVDVHNKPSTRAQVHRMVETKIQQVIETGADTLLAGDLGCLLNMAGKLQREGANIRVRHVAEVLAGMTDKPAIGEPRKN